MVECCGDAVLQQCEFDEVVVVFGVEVDVVRVDDEFDGVVVDLEVE